MHSAASTWARVPTTEPLNVRSTFGMSSERLEKTPLRARFEGDLSTVGEWHSMLGLLGGEPWTERSNGDAVISPLCQSDARFTQVPPSPLSLFYNGRCGDLYSDYLERPTARKKQSLGARDSLGMARYLL